MPLLNLDITRSYNPQKLLRVAAEWANKAITTIGQHQAQADLATVLIPKLQKIAEKSLHVATLPASQADREVLSLSAMVHNAIYTYKDRTLDKETNDSIETISLAVTATHIVYRRQLGYND